MPAPDTILAGLTAIANDWRWLAIAWHVVLGVSVALFLAGWRPPVRLVGYLLVAPFSSVSLAAWLEGNPFNGTVCAMLAAVLGAAAVRFPDTAVRTASTAWTGAGLALVVFGATYPHFARAESWLAYLYASPFGILPCPTLSVVIGSTLTFSNPGSKHWSSALAGAGLLYGVVGVFSLGVVLDLGLLLGAGVLAAAVVHDAIRTRSIRADLGERSVDSGGVRAGRAAR